MQFHNAGRLVFVWLKLDSRDKDVAESRPSLYFTDGAFLRIYYYFFASMLISPSACLSDHFYYDFYVYRDQGQCILMSVFARDCKVEHSVFNCYMLSLIVSLPL